MSGAEKKALQLARDGGRCRVCGLSVILAAEPDGKATTLFHLMPVCGAFDKDPQSTYAKEKVEWPAAN